MKSNSKFFLGLALGLAFGFVAFNIGTANSNNDPESVTVSPTETNAGTLISITPQQAEEMTGAYRGTIKGGQFSGKEMRSFLGGCLGDNTIYYRFAEENGQTGLVFYTNKNNAVKTDRASFRPVMCEIPD